MAATSLSEFVANNYHIVYPVQHRLEETHIFLLCEHHESEGHRKTNALFIDTFADPRSPVLVEAEKTGVQIDQKTNIQSAYLSRKFNVFGWDKSRVSEMVAKTPEMVQKIEEIRQWEISLALKKAGMEKTGKYSLSEIQEESGKLQRESFAFYRENDLLLPMFQYMNDQGVFLERNQGMIKTIAQFSGTGKKPAFLISGLSHLVPKASYSTFFPIEYADPQLDGINVTVLHPREST
ncbi:MAG: hypothetical protein JSR93_08910 [Verrucomicrobia bacterium]|nr:hypothetical protein [Verrucomicrobiota bacterium]